MSFLLAMRTITIFWLLLRCAFPAANAATVTGVVFSQSTLAPIPGATVKLIRSEIPLPVIVATTTTNSQGFYALYAPGPDTLKVSAQAVGYVGLEQNTTLPDNNAIVTVNIGLSQPATIRGRLSRAVDGVGLDSRQVTLIGESGYGLFWAQTDSEGNYEITNLAAGSYAVCMIDQADEYINECWDGVIPPFSGPPGSKLFELASGEVRDSVDIELSIGGGISGLVRDRTTNQPVATTTMSMLISAANLGQLLWSFDTDANGRYMVAGLPTANYRAELSSSPQAPYYTPQLYSAVDCLLDSCAGLVGTPISVTAGSDATSNIDFGLYPGATISGRVLDQISGAPIVDAFVGLYRKDSGSPSYSGFRGSVHTGGDGSFEIHHVSRLAHQVVVFSPLHVSQRWPGVPCIGFTCILNVPQGITVQAQGVLDIGTFLLGPGSVIHGRAHMPGFTYENVSVALYDQFGNTMLSISPDDSGNYSFPPWLPGTYFASSATFNHCERFRSLPCATPIGDSTPIVISAIGESVVADFGLYVDGVHHSGFE